MKGIQGIIAFLTLVLYVSSSDFESVGFGRKTSTIRRYSFSLAESIFGSRPSTSFPYLYCGLLLVLIVILAIISLNYSWLADVFDSTAPLVQ